MNRWERNLLTFLLSYEQTMAWVLCWCLSGIADICLQVVFFDHKEEWSKETIFWIWNFKGFVGNEGLLILTPFILSVPNDSEKSSNIGFYVHKPSVLVPRKPSEQGTTNNTRSQRIHVEEYSGDPVPVKKVESAREPEKERLSLDNDVNGNNVSGDNMITRNKILTNNPKNEEIILSIPKLSKENPFPSILYCSVHQSYRMANWNYLSKSDVT